MSTVYTRRARQACEGRAGVFSVIGPDTRPCIQVSSAKAGIASLAPAAATSARIAS
ncbi:hypothetical protein [Kutzneria sp. 744]|uniref:hypothetical protein n=1 Tax=Kutzneria sp. (strain 744) TaxID=345341 RepID=UPI0012FB6969|nr:hypothetical protein [Kutzneria sp. 744]